MCRAEGGSRSWEKCGCLLGTICLQCIQFVIFILMKIQEQNCDLQEKYMHIKFSETYSSMSCKRQNCDIQMLLCLFICFVFLFIHLSVCSYLCSLFTFTYIGMFSFFLKNTTLTLYIALHLFLFVKYYGYSPMLGHINLGQSFAVSVVFSKFLILPVFYLLL